MKWPIVTLLICLASVVAQAVPGAVELLQLDRAAVGSGQVWRLITGHLVHYGGNHLFWDVGVFLVLGAILEQIDRRRFVLTVVSSVLLISAAVVWVMPAVQYYRGLSGIDSALFGLLAGKLLRDSIVEKRQFGMIIVALMTVAFSLKLMIEMLGVSVFADDRSAHFAPVPAAHVVGFLVGMGPILLAASRMLRHDAADPPSQGWNGAGERRSVA